MENKLYVLELGLYFFIWISANFYSLYRLYEAQTYILANNQDALVNIPDLQPGWTSLSRLKDVSDVEWATWKYFMHISWLYLIIHFIVNEIVRKKYSSYLKYSYILTSVTFVLLRMGIRHLLIICTQPIIFGAIIFNGGKKLAIWITSLLLLICYNSLKYKYLLWMILDHDNIYDEEVYLMLFGIAWIELRCLSFSLDYLENSKSSLSKSKIEVMVDMLSYVLYLPLLLTGPVILYEDFNKSLNVVNEDLSSKIKRFMLDMSLFIMYGIFMEWSLHYIYFYALQADMELIRKIPTIALCGGGLYMGLHFHLIYVIAYGITTSFAKLDNMHAPPTPRCICRVHVYSDMWRYFDVGLYKFLVKYIYKPNFVIMSRYIQSTMAKKLIASLTTFIFIFLWHGTIKRIYIWCLLNYLGITLEYMGKAIYTGEPYKWFKEKILKTDAMEIRFIGLLCVPLLMLSAISNFYLFAGIEVGDLFFEYVMNPTLSNSLIIFVVLYCCCQVSIALEDVPARTAIKNSQSRVFYKIVQ